jgi:hypothetical protein
MAFDKVVDSSKLNAAMKATADKIRSESKTSSNIAWDESNGFADSIKTQTKTATPSTNLQAIRPDEGYVGLSQVNVEAIQATTQATPSISVSSSGLITASATQTAGYVAAGTKSATKQLSTQAAKTVTPSSSSQTAVAAGKYTTGAVTVAAIPSTFKKVATGTFALTQNNYYAGYTVSGLGFKPSRIILYLSPDVVSSASDDYVEDDGFNNITAYAICDGSTTTAVQMSWGTRWEWVDDVEELCPYVDPEIDTYEVNVTFTNNGFTVALKNWQAMDGSEYCYVAFS